MWHHQSENAAAERKYLRIDFDFVAFRKTFLHFVFHILQSLVIHNGKLRLPGMKIINSHENQTRTWLKILIFAQQ